MDIYNFGIFNVIDIINCIICIIFLEKRFLRTKDKIDGSEIFMILFFTFLILIFVFKIILLSIYIIKMYYKNKKKMEEYINLNFIINMSILLFLIILYYFNYNVNLYSSVLYYMIILTFINLCIIIFIKEIQNEI